MKKFIRQSEKYINGSYDKMEILHMLKRNNLYELLQWLESKLAETEKIRIELWVSGMFYITVEDQRKGFSYPEEVRLGFTVSIEDDCIFWSGYTGKYPQFPNGGNCFVRTSKWKKELYLKFGREFCQAGNVRIYSDVYPK